MSIEAQRLFFALQSLFETQGFFGRSLFRQMPPWGDIDHVDFRRGQFVKRTVDFGNGEVIRKNGRIFDGAVGHGAFL
jgi:hypothetical protein